MQPTALQSVRANSTRVHLEVGARPVRGPNLQSVRANPTRNLQTASANAASGQRPCNPSVPIRPVFTLRWALNRSEAPNLQSVRPNSTHNLCERCRALVELCPVSRRSNAASVISANVAVRSLNRARHSRFSACRALNKIGCSPIVSRTPRRADGRGSRLPVRCSLNKIGYSLLSGRIPHTTAGSRPPLLSTCVGALPMAPCSADARRAPGAVGVSRPWKTSAIAPALAIHGGLTPAALGHVRSIAKIVFRRRTFAQQHRSGGRQPPVDVIPHPNSQRGSS
jgi:hypothetical protein